MTGKYQYLYLVVSLDLALSLALKHLLAAELFAAAKYHRIPQITAITDCNLDFFHVRFTMWLFFSNNCPQPPRKWHRRVQKSKKRVNS